MIAIRWRDLAPTILLVALAAGAIGVGCEASCAWLLEHVKVEVR